MIIVPINGGVSPDMPQETAAPIARRDERNSVRAQLLQYRQGLTSSEHEVRNAQMVAELLDWLRHNAAADACIALYHAFKGEPDLTALAKAWRTQGGTVLLPIDNAVTPALLLRSKAPDPHGDAHSGPR